VTKIVNVKVGVIMPSCREHQAWFLTGHENREYRSEEERRFFLRQSQNLPEPTDELKEMIREFGQLVLRRPLLPRG
jgi:hypothetical protein